MKIPLAVNSLDTIYFELSISNCEGLVKGFEIYWGLVSLVGCTAVVTCQPQALGSRCDNLMI